MGTEGKRPRNVTRGGVQFVEVSVETSDEHRRRRRRRRKRMRRKRKKRRCRRRKRRRRRRRGRRMRRRSTLHVVPSLHGLFSGKGFSGLSRLVVSLLRVDVDGGRAVDCTVRLRAPHKLGEEGEGRNKIIQLVVLSSTIHSTRVSPFCYCPYTHTATLLPATCVVQHEV